MRVGASEFFELALAAAIRLFGLEPGTPRGAVVGVLVEMPVMLLVAQIANRSRHCCESGARPARV